MRAAASIGSWYTVVDTDHSGGRPAVPELAEVEHGRRVAERCAVGRVIATVWCDEDAIVLDGASAARIIEALRGARVEAVKRYGKQLWFELDRRPWPLFHFGMTGAFRVPGARTLELAASPKGGEPLSWPPRWTKIRLVFDDGGELVMTNKRRLGRIRLRQDPATEPPVSRLGFDPLLTLPSPADFARLVRRRKTPIKALLLNQSFAAGVGNWLADELLYQARVDPRRRASDLSNAEAERLRRAMHLVVTQAVEVDADKARFPADWLFHRRWGKPSDAVTTAGHRIETIRLAGRTTAWVPEVQH